MNISPEETFKRLQREPFEQVVKLVAEEAFIKAVDEDFKVVISIFSHPCTKAPSKEWMERYQSMGWTWKEIVEESKKRNDQMG